MAIVDTFPYIRSSLLDVWPRYFKKDDMSTDSTQLISTLSVFVIVTLWLMWKIFKKRGDPRMPGPRGLPLVGHLPFLDPELHTYFTGLAKTYGPIVKLMLGNKVGVVISSPTLAEEVLKDHDITFANRDVPVAALIATYGGADIVWSPYGPQWRMLRKVCVLKMLSNTTLDSVYNLRRLELRKTINYMYNLSGTPVNVGEQMFITTLNITTNMLWGGSVKGKERASLGSEFRQVVAELTSLLGTPNVSDFYPSLARFDLQGIEKKMKALVQRLDRIFDTMIDQRVKMNQEGLNGGKETNDFLQYMLKLKDEEDAKTPFTMTHLKAMLMEMVVGGTDTSSNTVEYALAEIMNKPRIMQKAQQELDTVVGKNNLVEESHLRELPYLNSIMKEILRLHPALPLLVPHCPSQASTIGGYTVPEGSRVFINVWAIHRDPTVWENPTEFDPERFTNSKWDFSGGNFKYFPFGSGRRICAGTAMAERIVLFSLASLLYSFDWKMPQGEKIDLCEKFGIVMKKKVPLVAIPIPRLADPALYV